MNLSYDGQLITASFFVTYRGKSFKIDDAIVDTGSSHTVISPDILERIGVNYENGDTVYEAYGIGGSVPFYTKIMDRLKIDTCMIENFEVDVGMLPKEHPALIGLDVLKRYHFIIDLEQLKLYPAIQCKEDLD